MCMKGKNGGYANTLIAISHEFCLSYIKSLCISTAFLVPVRWFPINGERSAFLNYITLTLKASENFLNSHLQTGHKLSCFLDCFLLRFVFEKHIFCY